MNKRLERCVSVDDVRLLARRRLPLPIYDLLAGGSCDEVTLGRNVAAFDEIELVPRVARDVSTVDASVQVLGADLSFPLILAPTGAQGFIDPEAEVAAARAAARAGIMYSLTTFSTASLEDVAAACDGPKMFQLYALQDQGVTDELIARAKEAGYDALCVTVDVPVNAGLERVKRWGMNAASGVPPLDTTLALARRPGWLLRQRKMAANRLPDVAKRLADRGAIIDRNFYEMIIRKDLTWDDLARIGEQWGGPFAIKGILSSADATLAAEAGATAIVVCNHGGTSLDSAPASISVLPDIVDTVGDRLEVIQCGGVRRGNAVVKALGLGAAAAMIGRPFLYGLAAAGEAGVTKVIEILRAEFETSMKLCGCTSVSESRSLDVRSGGPGTP